MCNDRQIKTQRESVCVRVRANKPARKREKESERVCESA